MHISVESISNLFIALKQNEKVKSSEHYRSVTDNKIIVLNNAYDKNPIDGFTQTIVLMKM